MSVGSNVSRLDGGEKVEGSAVYVDDLAPEGMLHGMTVRSPHARARIRGIHFDPDFDWSDIVRVDASDIAALTGGKGENIVALIEDDQPALAEKEVHHPTEPVLLLAAPTRERLEAAAAAVTVDYEPLAPVLTLDDAIAAGDETVMGTLEVKRGNLDAGFAEADHIIEGAWRTGHQEQMYIETNGIVATPKDDGGIRIQGSMQCPYYIHKALKRLLALEDSQVSVSQTVTGGGFGGKEEYPSILSAHASLLALKAGRPVKIIYKRGEDLQATTKRHPSLVRHRTGVKADGTLTAVEVEIDIDCGAYVTLSPVVMSRGILHGLGPYRCENVQLRARMRRTHTPPNGAFRGFGAPQVTFAYERQMDLVAQTLGMTPLALRQHNQVVEGDVLATGQVLSYSVGSKEVIERGLASSDYEAKWRQTDEGQAPVDAPPGKRYGIGLSFFFHGAGFTGNGEVRLQGKVTLELKAGGGIHIRSGSTDIGQGTKTIFPQIASDAVGIPMEKVTMAAQDTDVVPDSGPTVASRTAMVVGKIVLDAARGIGESVAAHAAAAKGADGAGARVEGGRVLLPGGEAIADFADAADAYLAEHGELSVSRIYGHPENIKFNDETYEGDAYPCYGWGCDVAEVLVDEDTGEVTVLRMYAVADVGKALHPILCEGQVEGGTLQGIGYGLMEEVVMQDGVMANNRMTNYIIPTSLDAPELITELVEVPYFYGPFGAKGVGELPLDGGAPALVSAVEQALGMTPGTFEEIPITPERVLAAIEQRDAAREGEAG